MDAINPDHYKRLPAEAIEIIEAAIDKAPSNQDAYLHGQALKYLLRCWNKNGIEDLRKAKWYLDRLVDSFDESEGHPAWIPEIGDWVRINKPDETQDLSTCWWPQMDKYDGQLIQVQEIDGDGVLHDDWGFLFKWLQPANEPRSPFSSDKIPEGYRKLGDSSGEPRQLGDLRWSVSEKRYIEISVDEIGYANRDNWAACRKIELAIKQSLTTEPPDGWRWLEVGEKILDGDKFFRNGDWLDCRFSVGDKIKKDAIPTIRRNRFEVGEKVVHVGDKDPIVYIVNGTRGDKQVLSSFRNIEYALYPNNLAPYIEEQS